MAHIGPIAETAYTVTLRRADFNRLVEAAEDAIDRAAINAQEAREAEFGKDAARADYLPAEAARRILAGESPVRIWREHRGMTARALAEVAGINAVYLSEIELGKKPGSVSAFVRLARALRVGVEDLAPDAD